MSRKKRDYSRELLPDPRYGNIVLARIMNMLMERGKKGVAEEATYGALDIIKEKAGADPMEVLTKAISNVRPLIEVRSRRVGGATYQVPSEVRAERSQSLAIRWLVQAANQRSEKRIVGRLAAEILDAASNRGNAVKKREDTHKMAEANKAFAHFKW